MNETCYNKILLLGQIKSMGKKQPISIRHQRRPKGILTAPGLNFLHLRNPWVVSWWSAAFPGLGHFLLGSYAKGFILVFWEVLINVKAGINTAIFLSLVGEFELAKEAIDKRWFFLYIPVYVLSIWDCYRLTVEMNKYSVIADREGSLVPAAQINMFSINFLDKRNPWIAAAWSLLMPGMGHIYIARLFVGFFIIGWWIAIVYFSNALPGIYCTAIGSFKEVGEIVSPQWLLFMPSLGLFAMWDAYVSTVEINKLYESEQSRFLKDNYQHPGLENVISAGGKQVC